MEYEIKFEIPDHLADVFDATRRNQFVTRQITEFLQRLVADEIVFVAERELNNIHPTIRRVQDGLQG